ncbi:cAMP-binding domain of CRP or a regulatory subunit of cAMP-dependent protein kinases [Seinonella peptonophila]|uniref:cAMP-binding domain of CRP or a regulatory subunit of cAMP-dependent protein kinases n=1 Tax=Seinonella peptonophila TaxID=112248 RepID=A0A1M4SYK7_9BACL|nr:Crp/Fnr family transcriptional regulator [Seinonella peptonophila]SHE37263.1 cAMP-binding domain of CRP or a regulatory subunit of cAMP-dependent protein kinases [Seinonella peptonophila]
MNFGKIVNNAPAHIRKSFTYRTYKKGSIILHPGEQNNYLYILTTGIAEVFRQTYAGTMLSVFIYQSYSCFGEIEIFNENVKTLSVIAKQNCEIIAIHKEKVYEWMKMDFNFNFYIVKQLASKLILSSDIVAKLSLLTVKDRVLLSIYNHYKMGDLHNLTKQVLSSEACAPIRSVNRSIAQFVNEGFIDYKDKNFYVKSVIELEKNVECISLSETY